MALTPLVLVGFIANAATKRIERYRRASRQATGKVTGFIGEFFGAVQAVKVATAEKNVIGHFNRLNEERRKLSLRERLFGEMLDSIYRNTASLGTGVILILAGQAMRAGTFTIGDFSLFVYLLQSMSDLTTFAGKIVGALPAAERLGRAHVPADGRRAAGGVGRDQPGQPGWPAAGSLADPIRRTVPTDLETLEAEDLSYHYPGS